MSDIRANIERIRNEIAEAALRSGRNPESVRLMAVTKTVGEERIAEAIGTGIRLFGENYVQEAKRKIELLGRPEGIEWHMIGSLQSNKAKYAVHLFDLIHSVSTEGLAAELDRRASAAGRVMPVLVEVNLGGEESKSGLEAGGAIPFIREISRFPNLAIRGLMTMPPWSDDPENSRPYFRKLRDLSRAVEDEGIPGVVMQELSMGMTQDYIAAVEEGSTIVRVGRGIFGARPN